MFDLLVARHELFEIEGRANATDAFAGRRRTRDVIQQVIQEVVDGTLLVGKQTLVDDVLELPVRLAEQALERNRSFEAAVLQ